MAETVSEPMPCPLCRSPHTNLARDLSGEKRQIFCKSCGCQAPIAAWNRRATDPAVAELLEALEWYANPEIYKAHQHGLAFDDRDLSFHAKAILAKHAAKQEKDHG